MPASTLPDWRVERGIGEERHVRIADGRIAEARIHLDEAPRAGAVLDARLRSTGRPAVAVAGGVEYLLPAGAPGITEGATVAIEVTREPIPGVEPWKRPLARVFGEATGSPDLHDPIPFPSPEDALEAAGWSELLDEARTGLIDFTGGQLRVSLTPAMTLVDVDGQRPPEALGIAAATAAAKAILRHSIGGSIGIDFPTVTGKAARAAIAAAIDDILPKPFERTAVNGFGFVQIVRPRRWPSTFEHASDLPRFEARALLRRAARERGALTLRVNPMVAAVIAPGWLETLARQVGGSVGLRIDTGLAMSGGHAEPA